MELKGLSGGIHWISEWVMRLSIINLLWVVFSLPFFFFIFTFMFTPGQNADMIKQLIGLSALVAPFSVIPASAGMFAAARKWVTGEEDVPLFKTFWRGYRENYVKSMLGGFIYLAMAGLFYVNYLFYESKGGILGMIAIVFIILFVLLTASFFNFLSIMVHFHMNLKQIIKNSMLMTFGSLIHSILLLLVNGVILLLSVRYTFLIPFFMGSLSATASFWLFYSSYSRLEDKKAKMVLREEGEDGTPSNLQEGATPKKEKDEFGRM